MVMKSSRRSTSKGILLLLRSGYVWSLRHWKRASCSGAEAAGSTLMDMEAIEGIGGYVDFPQKEKENDSQKGLMIQW